MPDLRRYRLTDRKLEAIVEALCFRIAGEIEEGNLTPEDYDAALAWAIATRQHRLEHARGVAHMRRSMGP